MVERSIQRNNCICWAGSDVFVKYHCANWVRFFHGELLSQYISINRAVLGAWGLSFGRKDDDKYAREVPGGTRTTPPNNKKRIVINDNSTAGRRRFPTTLPLAVYPNHDDGSGGRQEKEKDETRRRNTRGRGLIYIITHNII